MDQPQRRTHGRGRPTVETEWGRELREAETTLEMGVTADLI